MTTMTVSRRQTVILEVLPQAKGWISVRCCGDSPSQLHADEDLLLNNLTQPAVEFSQGSVIPQNLLVPTGISKLTELTLDQFKNNFRLFAKKLVNVDSDLVIRVILLKNNVVFL